MGECRTAFNFLSLGGSLIPALITGCLIGLSAAAVANDVADEDAVVGSGLTVDTVAEERYCLSGGNRTAYSCERENSAGQLVRERYAVQIVTDQTSQGLQGLAYTQLHETPVDGGKRLVYLGDFQDLDAGRQALADIGQQLGRSYSPLLVAFTPREPLPRIRLVEEPDQGLLQLAESEQVSPAGEATDTADVVPIPVSDTVREIVPDPDPAQSESQYDLVYSIQIGAFKYASYGQRFAKRHAKIPLQCRQKNNGIFAVYYGLFENFSDAKGHLQDYALLEELGAYVVKLRNVSFSPCDALATRIKQSRQAAYGENRCGGSQGCDVRATTKQFLPKLPGIE